MSNIYSSYSNFEINCLVSAEVWKKSCTDSGVWNDYTEKVYKSLQCGEYTRWVVSLCDAWEHGMPIVVENGISLVYMVGDWEAHALTEFGDEAHNTVNKNPLRAAMEVFLMMKDAEKENEN